MKKINIYIKKQHLLLIAVTIIFSIFLLLFLLLPACDGPGSTAMSAGQLSTEEEPLIEDQEINGSASSAQEALSSGTDDDTIEKNILVAGTDATFPPFAFTEEGTIIGFDVDIVTEIANRLEKQIEIRPSKWDLEFNELLDGNLDLVISAIPYNDVIEKDAIVDFSNPYFNMKFLLIVLAESEIKLKENLVNANVGILESSMECLEKEYLSDFNISYYKDVIEMIDTLKNKQIDAILLNLPIAMNLIKENKDIYIVLEEKVSLKDLVIVFKNNSSLKPEVDKALDEIKSDGTYEEIYFKWFAY